MFIQCIWLNNIQYNFFENYSINFERSKENDSFFSPLYRLVDFLYSLGLEFVASTCAKKFHARKHVKLYINIYV